MKKLPIINLLTPILLYQMGQNAHASLYTETYPNNFEIRVSDTTALQVKQSAHTIDASNSYFAYSSAAYGSLVTEISHSGFFAPTAKSGFADIFTIDSPSLNGLTGMLTTRWHINTSVDYLHKWNVTINDNILLSNNTYGRYQETVSVQTSFTFGKPLNIEGSVTTQEGALRNSGPSGITALYYLGVESITLPNGNSVDLSLLNIISQLSPTSFITQSSPVGFTPQNPTLPSSASGSGGFIIPAPPSIFCPNCPNGIPPANGATVIGRRGAYIDPDIAIGYNYEATGDVVFNGIIIPQNYGDGVFELWLYDKLTGEYMNSGKKIYTNSFFEFTSELGSTNGLTKFGLRGIDLSEMIDPNDPLGFITGVDYSGVGDIVMSPVTISAPIPEPDTSALMLAGLGLVSYAARCRSRIFSQTMQS